jgi:hypothetical protein
MDSHPARLDGLPELLDAQGLLERLWPDPRSRPSLRWLREQQKRKTVPYIKWGRRIFFHPADVAIAIREKLTVQPSRLSRNKRLTDS